MTRTIFRSFALISLGLTLTACAQHQPLQANCFNFRETPAEATSATVVSSMGTDVTRHDTSCTFMLLGADD